MHISRNSTNGEVTLTQEGLAKRIVSALGCDDLPAVSTPADDVLGKDEDGEPPCCTFNYASVIGMLWYLYGHSRPDIGFAVSQAARFSFAPRRSHELALIRIGQYLKGTIDKGMILKPMSTNSFKMDAYVAEDTLQRVYQVSGSGLSIRREADVFLGAAQGTDLINEAGVALVPGSAFGTPGHVRISFATSQQNLDSAVDRIAAVLKA